MRELICELTSRSSDQTEQAGTDFAALLPSDAFVAMYGDLGAGKTAFVRGMASVLTPGAAVTSPTYTLVNEYRAGGNVFCHFDMYRIGDEDDLYSIGFFDYSNCVIAAEWSEKIPFALPEKYYSVSIEKLHTEDSSNGNSNGIAIGAEDRQPRRIKIELISGK